LAGSTLSVAGCDGRGDVWTARNAVSLSDLLPSLKPIWSSLETLSESGTAAIEGVPAIGADPQGKLYTLWSQADPAGMAGASLYAAVWDGARWSRGAPVLTQKEAGAGRAVQPSLAADAQGRLHVVWNNGQVVYSWKYARDAGAAQGWATPWPLPSVSTASSWPDIVADPRGETLHVVYAVPYNEGRGIYYVRSSDGGQTWGKPVAVFDAAAAKWDSADKPRLALDAQMDVLHIVWLRALPAESNGQMVYYARSTDGGQTWNAPIKLAEGVVNWPRVAVMGTGRVAVIWDQVRARGAVTAPYEVWAQFSLDGGQRWTEAARVRGFEQVSGPAGLASDGAGSLYVLGLGLKPGGESALLYARWDGRAWADADRAGLGQDAALGNAVSAAFAPGANRLGVALRQRAFQAPRQTAPAPDVAGQVSGSEFQVAASGRELAPAARPAPAPTFTPMPASTLLPTATPGPTSTPRPRVSAAVVETPGRSVSPWVVGATLAVLLVAGVVAARLRSR
jgi:hypothetical protein